MDSITLATLAEVVGGQLRTSGPTSVRVRHASIHSDHIRGGTAFFALPGAHTDGHRFVERALANGAVVAVVSTRAEAAVPATARPLVLVDEPFHALRRLAAWWRARLPAAFIAVVGNVGKTVTKDALVHFLGYGRNVFGSPGSYNSQIGVPLSILECPRDASLAVIEAAATEPGEMARLAELIAPSYVVLTNLGSRWQSNFADTAAQAREMLTMASGLPESGWLLVGEPDPVLRQAVALCPATGYVLHESAGLAAFSPVNYGLEGIFAQVTFPGSGAGTLSVRTPSQHIAADVQLALTAAGLLGVPPTSLLQAARDYTPTSARMEVWRSPAGVTVIRDVATTHGATFAGAARMARRLTKAGSRTTVVLAETYDRCGDEVAALGQTIGRAGIDELCALTLPAHNAIVRGALSVAPDLTVYQFPSDLTMREHLAASLRAEDVVLIQSPRDRTISELSLSLVEPIAPTRLYIDQSAIESNVTSLRRLIGPDVLLMGMVKALAYGTNPVQISLCLESAGVDALAVAAVDEGVALRRAGVSLDTILVTLATEAEIERMARSRLTPLIYSPGMLDAALRYADSDGPPLRVHLEVDSGMHRTGFGPENAVKALQRLRDVPGITMAGLMTHFACADEPAKDDLTQGQLALFEQVVDAARELGFSGFLRHAANTAATMRLPAARLDMVRIGIGLFGVYPAAEATGHAKLTPAISLVGKVVEIHQLGPGEPVGYGATYRTRRQGSRIGVVAAGYHDGVPRAFSNHGSVVVNGQVCPIVGTVSMDSMTIDLSDCPDAAVGTDVAIYGGYGKSFLAIEEVARRVGTIPYELLARIGPRVQRVFTRH